VCFIAKSAHQLHVSHACPERRRRCFVCLASTHFSRQCPIDRKVREACHYCCLPARAAQVQIHQDETFGKQECKLVVIREALQLLWEKSQEKIHILVPETKGMNDSQFFNFLWKTRDSFGLPKGASLFLQADELY